MNRNIKLLKESKKEMLFSELHVLLISGLDELLSRIDSMAVEEDVLQLYCQDVPLADLRVSDDSLLCCHYRNRKDTLLRGVEKMVLDGDTLIIQFCLSQEKIRYRWNINRTIWP